MVGIQRRCINCTDAQGLRLISKLGVGRGLRVKITVCRNVPKKRVGKRPPHRTPSRFHGAMATMHVRFGLHQQAQGSCVGVSLWSASIGDSNRTRSIESLQLLASRAVQVDVSGLSTMNRVTARTFSPGAAMSAQPDRGQNSEKKSVMSH